MHTLAFLGPCGRPAGRNLLVLGFHLLALGGLDLPGATGTNSPAVPTNAPAANPLPVIRTVRQLLDLPKPEAQRHYPVELRAVVTYFDSASRTLFVQDPTAGVWVYRTFPQTNLHAGDLLSIKGVSDAVNVSSVRPRELSVVDTAPLPATRPATYDRLIHGTEDCQRVQTRGVIRSMRWHDGLLQMALVSGHDRVDLYLPDFGHLPLPTNLVGAEVLADGVCSMRASPEGQMAGFWFYVQETNHLTILRPGATDPYQLEIRPVKSLWTYGTRDSGTQVHIRSTVTFAAPDRIYVQDESSPLLVRLRPPWAHGDPNGRYHDPPPSPPVQPGDIVEAWGYLSPRTTPALEDSQYRRVGRGVSPSPVFLQVPEAVAREMDGQLISVVGQLLERESYFAASHTNRVLILQGDGVVFEAQLSHAPTPDWGIAPNSMLRLTGINSIQPDAWNQPRPFRLLLRGAGDVTVLRTPSRLTLRNASRLAAAGLLAALVVIGWNFILHRQVRLQTARLSERTEDLRKALFAEKELNQLKSNFVSIVSHEFRSPLGAIQSSAELLKHYYDRLTPPRRGKLIEDIIGATNDMARLMEDVLLLSRVESVRYEFQPRPLSLAELCQRLSDEVSSATHARCPIRMVLGPLPDRTRGDEGLLRHILNNLLSNAVKYSPAGTPVEFGVEQDHQEAVFTVQDRGIGIPIEDQPRLFQAFHRGNNVGATPGTGLGLVIVQRCVALHGGTLSIQSQPGAGTTATVRLPLFRNEDSAPPRSVPEREPAPPAHP